MLPIRETVLQDFKDIQIPCKTKDFFEEKKEQATATSINSESDDEFEQYSKASHYKNSIVLIKETATIKNNEIFKERIKLEESLKELLSKKNEADEIEGKIAEKRKEMSRIIFSTKEYLSKVFDANLELERLQGDDINELADRNNLLQKKLLEVSKECKVHKLQLENLRKEVNKESIGLLTNETNLKKLQNTLKSIQEMTKHGNCDRRSSENELRLSIDLLKKQLHEKTNILSTFNSDELLIAKEISGVIKSNMHSFNNLTRNIQKNLEITEEKSNEIEQQMHELNISYEMKKSSIFQSFRKAKDEYSQKQRNLKEESIYKIRKNNEVIRDNIRAKLNNARKINFPIDDTDIINAKNRIQVIYM